MSNIEGKALSGQAVNDHKFQGVTTLNQIQDYGLLRPTLVSKVNLKSGDDHEKQARKIHEDVQRRFDSARLRRATQYSGYIERVEVHGGIGGTPAITLFHHKALEVSSEGDLIIPYNAILTAVDGETQTEARYILKERLPETGGNKFAVTVYHGMSTDGAQQILHDYNSLGKPVTESQTFGFNKAGKLTVAMNAAISASGADESRFNRNGAKATKKTVVAHKQLLNALAGFVLNGAGAERSAASQFKSLNSPNANDVPLEGVNGVTHFIKFAFSNPILGQANAQVWQMAGVLLSKGKAPGDINWRAGVDAYEQTMTAGRGGERIAIKERLSRIEAAM